MSSDHPSGDPSPRAEGDEGGLAALVSERGAALVDALDRHLPGAREHAEATASYAFAAAAELGHDRGRAELVRETARLHDVGKVYVPAALLALPADSLDAGERAGIERHNEAGSRLARGAGIPDHVCGLILRVRERFDGAGPEGLAAELIPIESRVARAACAYDEALAGSAGSGASAAARRRGAVDVLRASASHELDPQVVAALIAIVDRAASGGSGGGC